MKRFLCLLAILQFCIIGWSQTMTIDFKDGSTQKINMNDIRAITFTQDEEQTEVSIVGVWECTSYVCETEFPELIGDDGMQKGSVVNFKSDGTYSTSYGEEGKWSLKWDTLTLTKSSSVSVPFNYKVTTLTSSSLEISIDLKIAKVTYKFKRVS